MRSGAVPRCERRLGGTALGRAATSSREHLSFWLGNQLFFVRFEGLVRGTAIAAG